jgi:hypothetical protein
VRMKQYAAGNGHYLYTNNQPAHLANMARMVFVRWRFVEGKWKMYSIVKRWRHCRSSSCSRNFVTKDEGEVETRNRGKNQIAPFEKDIRWLWLD